MIRPFRTGNALPLDTLTLTSVQVARARRCVTLSRQHPRAGMLCADVDFVEAAIARMTRRLIPDHVIETVGLHAVIDFDLEGDRRGALGASGCLSFDAYGPIQRNGNLLVGGGWWKY